jgi:Ferredoxin-like domain in Api92-like protein
MSSCTNKITLKFDTEEDEKEFFNYIKGVPNGCKEETEFCFDSIIPHSGTDEDEEYWRIQHWGTFSEPNAIKIQRSDLYAEVSFDTEWFPPHGIYLELAKKFKNVDIRWYYHDANMVSCGYLDQDLADAVFAKDMVDKLVQLVGDHKNIAKITNCLSMIHWRFGWIADSQWIDDTRSLLQIASAER